MQTGHLRFGPAYLTTIEGVMEGVPHDAFSGWVWKTNDPQVELSVEIVGPGLYLHIPAADYRYDLADAGKRNGNCWFTIAVPADAPNQTQAVALLAGTSHRLRSAAEASRTLEADWLDTQPLDFQLAISAQRIRFGLHRPPLSASQIAGIVEAADDDGFDLSQLVDRVAGLSD